jgi:hypothetical protein
MKKKGLAYAVLFIAFALVNVIAFFIPTEKTATFWIAYAFSAIAFLLQIGIWKLAFKGTDTIKSKFLGIPLLSVGFRYLAIQVIAFAVSMIFPSLPTWIPIVVCSVILGGSAICLIGTETGREEIKSVEEKVKSKVFYIKSLQVDVEMLAETESDPSIKAELTKLAEKIRFSDPMSSDALAEIETGIANKIKEIKTSNDKLAIIAVTTALVEERNKKAKILK